MSDLAKLTAARMDGKPVSLQSVLHAMKITDRLADFRHAVDDLLIQQAAEREGIAPTDAELQAESDSLRAAMGLQQAAATQAWLKQRGMNIDDFETYILRLVSARMLKQKVAADKVEAYFVEHRPAFDAARISRLAFGSEETASDAERQLAAGATTFASLADRFPADASAAPVDGAGFVFRLHLDPALAAAIFRASPGDVVGPVLTARGAHELAQVHEVRRAELDERTSALIEDLLFGVWLRGERERAQLEFMLPSLI